jgi:hypothetical protein
MSDPTQNRPLSSHVGLRTPRHVISPDHDASVQRSTLAAVRAALERAGLDVEHLDVQRRQSRAKLEAALDRFRAESDERAAAMQHAVARSAENWLAAHRVGPALAPATGVYALSTADTISADPGFDLLAENTGPWANTAQVVFGEQTSDVTYFDGRVNFAFSWPNPTGQDLLCNITGQVNLAAPARPVLTHQGGKHEFAAVTQPPVNPAIPRLPRARVLTSWLGGWIADGSTAGWVMGSLPGVWLERIDAERSKASTRGSRRHGSAVGGVLRV